MNVQKVFLASSLDEAPGIVREIRENLRVCRAELVYHSEDDLASGAESEKIRKEIDSCDCFVAVVRSRYGTPRKESGRSWFHDQVIMAHELGKKPFFAFILDSAERDRDTQESKERFEGFLELKNFIRKNRYLEEVTSEEDLLGRLKRGFIWHFRIRKDDNQIVIISSTYGDLAKERAALEEAVRTSGLGLPTIMFEALPKGMDATETSRLLAQKAGLYLGLISEHRGSRIPNENKTYTELEYEEAFGQKTPITFFENPGLPVPARIQQSWDDAESSRSFNRLLRDRHSPVIGFNSPEELYHRALDSICEKIDEGKAYPVEELGGDDTSIPAPPETYFVHDYSLTIGTSLVGRSEELSRLNQWIEDPSSSLFSDRVYCIEALGGMGKSALAWTWVSQIPEGTFEAVVWYSFYAVESGPHEFAESVLPYLSRLSEVGEIVDSSLSPLEKVLRIVERRKVLLVLDGLERRMKLYTDFHARSTEGGELHKIVEALIERHKMAFQAENSEEVAKELARKECYSMLKEDAEMLQRLARNTISRTLITTRFFPSDLEGEGKSKLDGVNGEKLEEFDKSKAIELAAALQVGWTGELAELRQKVGGYPLYLGLAMEYVRGNPGSTTTIAERRERLSHALSPDPETARVAVITLGLDELSPHQLEVLYEIEACPIGSTFSHLRRALCVGPQAPFSAPSELEKVLRELHGRKLIGWDTGTGSCDMHPVVREAVRRHCPPESLKKIKERHQEIGSEIEIGGRVSARISTKIREPLTHLYLIYRDGTVENAAAAYISTIDPKFRYNSGEMDKRLFWLKLFLDWESQLSKTTRVHLLSGMADSAVLAGHPEVGEKYARRAIDLAGGIGDTNVLNLARIKSVYALSDLGRLAEADSLLVKIISDNINNINGDSGRWAYCNKISLNLDIGKLDEAEKLRSIVVATYSGDADVLKAEFQLALDAIERGQSEDLAIEIHENLKEACRREGLYYGSTVAANRAAQLALRLGSRKEWMEDIEAVLNDQAASAFIYNRMDLRITLARIKVREGYSEVGREMAFSILEMARERGLRELEGFSCLALAEAACALANEGGTSKAEMKDEARYYAQEAAICAKADGYPYCYGRLVREIREFYDKCFGEEMPAIPEIDPFKLAAVPEMPEFPEPKVLREDITDVRGMTEPEVFELIDSGRADIEWDQTTGSARKWWSTFEEENKHRPALILRLMEELRNRSATISEFFLSYVYSNTDNIQANLHYLDYSRLKKAEDGEQADPPGEDSAVPSGFTDTTGWSEQKIRDEIELLKHRLDLEQTTGSARKWWEDFEEENHEKSALLLRFLEELQARDATLTEFFRAYTSSNTDNIQANLYYLDYSRFKKEEEKQREKQRLDEIIKRTSEEDYKLTKEEAELLLESDLGDLPEAQQVELRNIANTAMAQAEERQKLEEASNLARKILAEDGRGITVDRDELDNLIEHLSEVAQDNEAGRLEERVSEVKRRHDDADRLQQDILDQFKTDSSSSFELSEEDVGLLRHADRMVLTPEEQQKMEDLILEAAQRQREEEAVQAAIAGDYSSLTREKIELLKLRLEENKEQENADAITKAIAEVEKRLKSARAELLFIRCSSCRSLIPAASVRCRLCGNEIS